MRMLVLLLFLAAGLPVMAQIRLPGSPAPMNPRFVPSPQAHFKSPFLDPHRPVALPTPKVTVTPIPKVVNVDTAIAKLMQSAGDFYATGTMEFWSTNSGKLDVKRFPFSISVLEGRIRTELSLQYIQEEFDKTATWATLRQIGIERVVSVTLPRLSAVKVMFPAVESYVSKDLHSADVPAYMRTQKILVGPQKLNDQTFEKFDGALEYSTGDRIPVELWQLPGLESLPSYMKINHKEGSAVTIHLEKIQRGKVPAKLFETPQSYSQYADMGVMLQMVSARYEQEKSMLQPPGQRSRSPGVIRARPDGLFPRSAVTPR
jgi:hypothetical protein